MELPLSPVLLAQGLASHLFLAGVLVITVTLIYRTQRRLIQMRREYARSTGLPRARASDPGERTVSSPGTGPAAHWEVQLHQVARQYLAQAQTQSAVLERQLREARALSRQLARQLEQLHRLQAGLGGETASGAALQCSEPGGEEKEQPPAADNVLAMAARGCSAEQIAAVLGRPRGEVELLLRLHRTSNSPPGKVRAP